MFFYLNLKIIYNYIKKDETIKNDGFKWNIKNPMKFEPYLINW